MSGFSYKNEVSERIKKEYWNDKEFCLKTITYDYYPSNHIPKEYWNDREFCIKAISKNGNILKEINASFVDYDFCFLSIKNKGDIKLIPKKYLTREICLEAIKNYPSSIQNIPKKYLNLEFYYEALMVNNGIAYALQNKIKKKLEKKYNILFLGGNKFKKL
jgi:hypothetical protein